ncbi:hypothetical protein [Mycobacterium sp. E802]|uniref:hypothetical protein n=1 Tax=Mycobacterium sp. E802 TaxID=1834152 RepID=UPI0012F96E14|nr:hypothetical protein [Mycobacterium sp. E802]
MVVFLAGLTGEFVQVQILGNATPIAERGVGTSFVTGGIIWLVIGLAIYLVRRRVKAAKNDAKVLPAASFDTWSDPPPRIAVEQWEQRLNALALESAAQLQSAGVPLFRSEFARDGRGTYRDSFWLIAVDVERARRGWWACDPAILGQYAPRQSRASDPPAPKRGDLAGNFQAQALLLTKSGRLCVARCEGWFKSSGGVDAQCMDMLFRAEEHSEVSLKSHEWGLFNHGRWRQDPSSDYRRDGLDVKVQSIQFEENYFNDGPRYHDGRYTSSAVADFVKSGGVTMWPKGFISFDY